MSGLYYCVWISLSTLVGTLQSVKFQTCKTTRLFLDVFTAVHKIIPAQKTKFMDHSLQQILLGVISLEGGCVDSLPGWRLIRRGGGGELNNFGLM